MRERDNKQTRAAGYLEGRMFQKCHRPMGIVKVGYYRNDGRREILHWSLPQDELRRRNGEGKPATVLFVDSQIKSGNSGQQVIERLKRDKEYDLKVYYAVLVACGVEIKSDRLDERTLDMRQLFDALHNRDFLPLVDGLHLPDFLAFVSEKVILPPGGIP